MHVAFRNTPSTFQSRPISFLPSCHVPRACCCLKLSRTLLDVDRIIVPVNIGNTHWTCVPIDLQNRCVVYYNSMVTHLGGPLVGNLSYCQLLLLPVVTFNLHRNLCFLNLGGVLSLIRH